MKYIRRYDSPIGRLLLASDGNALTGLWFEGQKYFAAGLDAECREMDLPVFQLAEKWLSMYFSGEEPDFSPALHLVGTDFQRKVWDILLSIPYGQTVTYGQIAAQMGCPMSAQAVGGAVGRNPVSIIVPCHRVVGKNGSLTGYAGGTERKAALLKLEHHNI